MTTAVLLNPLGWTARRHAANVRLSHEDSHVQALLRPRHLRAGFAHCFGRGRRPYTAERLDFKNNQQTSPQYLAINPKGRVPALVTDRGTLTETPAILAFIAQSFPQAKLVPDDPFAFAQAQSFNSYLCSTVHVSHAHKMRGYRWADRGILVRRHEAQGAGNHGRQLWLIERDMLEGAVGDGRAIHGLRPLSVHDRALA